MKRKTLLFITSLLCFATVTHAQIPKGSTLLGGGVGFFTSKEKQEGTESGKSNSVHIFPAWGKAIKENTILGVTLECSYYDYNNHYSGYVDQKFSNYGASVFLRKYVLVANRFYIFGQGNAGGGYSTSKVYYSNYQNSSKGWNAGISLFPGVSYAVNKKFHLEAGFNNLAYIEFSHTKTTDGSAPGNSGIIKTNGFSLGSDLDSFSSLYLGFRFLLTKNS